jgi:PTS system nitrogen regulatory IIA component
MEPGENLLADVLGPNDVHLDVDASNSVDLLAQIASLLAGRHGLAKDQVLQSLTAREQLGSTGLGHGVAMPHARMYECGLATGAFVRTRAPVPFDAPDGKPVSLFLALVVPKHATQWHLNLLASAAALFSDRGLREALLTSTDAASVRGLLVKQPVTGDYAAGKL